MPARKGAAPAKKKAPAKKQLSKRKQEQAKLLAEAEAARKRMLADSENGFNKPTDGVDYVDLFLAQKDRLLNPQRAGRPPVFESPETLYQKCLEYIKWIKERPMYESRLVSYKGHSEIKWVPKERPMTRTLLYAFLGISHNCWRDYRQKPGFSTVCNDIEKIMQGQKIEGAANNMFNPAIIGLEMGVLKRKEEEEEEETTPTEIQRTFIDPSDDD